MHIPFAIHRREFFPVASWLMPRGQRCDMLALYAFARHADDLADDPTLSAETRRERLEVLKQAFETGNAVVLPGWAAPLFALCAEGRCRAEDALSLLSAFLLDTTRARYDTLEELFAYCRLSADPVGRMVLDLHGEHAADRTAADALCTALQLINHVRDEREDRERLGRSYIPHAWVLESGLVLAKMRLLDHADLLLREAALLPATIQTWSLRQQVRAILFCARRLSARLRVR